MRNNRLRFLLCLVFLVGISFSGCAYRAKGVLLEEAPLKQPAIVIKHATVFTGNPGQAFMEDCHILIQGVRITKIHLGDEIDVPDCYVIDATGKFVVPGLIDSHMHSYGSSAPPSILSVPNPERTMPAFLYAGITTVVDMGGPVGDVEGLKQAIDSGEILGPRLSYAGRFFTAAGGHPAAMIRRMVFWPMRYFVVGASVNELEPDTDVAQLIQDNREWGANMTKVVVDQIPLGVPSLNAEQLADIAKASKEADLPVVAHVGSEEDILTCLEAGVHIFVHCPYRSDLSPDTITRMKQANAIVTPTLTVFDNIVRLGQHNLVISDMDREIASPYILKECGTYQADMTDPDFREWARDAAQYQDTKFETVRRLKKAGIPLIVGSDSPNVALFPGSSLHREMELWVTRCGFTPVEAVAAATYVPGRLYEKIIGIPHLGHIQEGAPADLLILNADFRKDIRNTRDINTVILKGNIVQRIPKGRLSCAP